MQLQSIIVCAFLALGLATAQSTTTKDPNKAADGDYQPCKKQVSVFFDNTKDMSKKVYKSLQGLLKNFFLLDFNHFERLAVGTFDGTGVNVMGVGDFRTQKDVENYIDSVDQYSSGPVLEYLFNALATDHMDSLGMDQTIVILTGRFNEKDAKKVDRYAEKIKKNSYLSMIGFQDSVNVTSLSKVADFSYSFDLSKGLPNDIYGVIKDAIGCNF